MRNEENGLGHFLIEEINSEENLLKWLPQWGIE